MADMALPAKWFVPVSGFYRTGKPKWLPSGQLFRKALKVVRLCHLTLISSGLLAKPSVDASLFPSSARGPRPQ